MIAATCLQSAPPNASAAPERQLEELAIARRQLRARVVPADHDQPFDQQRSGSILNQHDPGRQQHAEPRGVP